MPNLTYPRQQALQNPETLATVVHAILRQQYGEEVYDWDPVTVYLECQADFAADIQLTGHLVLQLSGRPGIRSEAGRFGDSGVCHASDRAGLLRKKYHDSGGRRGIQPSDVFSPDG